MNINLLITLIKWDWNLRNTREQSFNEWLNKLDTLLLGD
jgi:hypothetical protein